MKVGSWGLTSALGGHRATRATVAALVVVAAAVVAFGTGYRSTRALTNDESAWLRKGDTIVHINGPSARYDAVVSDKPNPIADAASDPLEVVQDQGGKVYTADPLTHKVYEIQLDRMTPVPGPNGTSVLAAGKVAYILDRAKRTLTAVNPKTMAPGATVRIPGPVTGQAIAPNGTVYIGQSDGSLTIVSHGQAHTAQIAPKHSSLEVSMVGGRPVAVDVTHGRLYPLGANGRPTRSIAVPGGSGQRFEVPPSLAGQQAWLVHGSQLVGIDLAQGRAHTMALPSGHAFGSPVVNAGRVFVPDDTAGQVLQYQTTRQGALPPIAVPAGAPGVHDIEAFAKNGQVWIDNPSSQDAAMVGADGGVRTIDKGTGNDVVNPHARPGPARLAAPSAPGQGTGTNAALSGPPTADPSSLVPATSVAGDAGGFGAATAPGPGTGFGGGAPGGTGGASGFGGGASGPTAFGGAAPGGTGGGGAGAPGPTPPAGTPSTTTTTTPAPASTTTTSGLVRVPTPQSRETPGTYCNRVVAAGLTCSSSDRGQAPPGTPTDVVLSVDPAAGTEVAPGTHVTAFFDSKTTPTGQVPNVVGMETATACSTLQSNNPALTCKLTDRGVAPAGTKAGVVVSQSPTAPNVVPVNTAVTITFYGSAPVPAPQAGESPQNYCARVDLLGLVCSQSPQTNAPTSATLNTVFATSPPAGTAVAAGHAVAAEYYLAFAPVTVPSCVGARPTACPPTAGITWVGNPASIASANIACNTVYGQSQPAGASVPYGTSVSVSYDPNCAIWFGEYHLNNNTGVWLESTNPNLGPPWVQQSFAGAAYPYNGGCAKAGTTPLDQYEYGAGQAFFFSVNGPPNQSGWRLDSPIACVFPPSFPATGSVPVYDHLINKGPPEKHSWELTPSAGQPNPDWYQPDHQG